MLVAVVQNKGQCHVGVKIASPVYGSWMLASPFAYADALGLPRLVRTAFSFADQSILIAGVKAHAGVTPGQPEVIA